MADIESTQSMWNISFLNLGYRDELRESMWSNSLIGGNSGKIVAKNLFTKQSTESAEGIHLYYVPDTITSFVYEQRELDKTVLDITVTNLDISTIQSIVTAMDNTDIRVRAMQLNKYEFIILFYIDCDYISDINLTADQDTDNEFVQSYIVTKLTLAGSNIGFKFSQRFTNN